MMDVNSINFFSYILVVIPEFTIIQQDTTNICLETIYLQFYFIWLGLKTFFTFINGINGKNFSSFDAFLCIQQASKKLTFLVFRHFIFACWRALIAKPVKLEPE